jgi:heme-degrading monooxygenase HmoA
MSVIMIAEVPGADASFFDGMRAAGVVDAIAKAPGFVSHLSGAASSGYRVIEVWESREDHQAWYDNHVSPNLPPGIGPITPEYIDLVAEVPGH